MRLSQRTRALQFPRGKVHKENRILTIGEQISVVGSRFNVSDQAVGWPRHGLPN